MQTIYLDISNKGVVPCIEAKQSEVGRKFLAVITDNGIPYNIPNDSLLSVWYEGDTDAGNYSSIEEKSAFGIDGNKVTVELVAQMLLKPGTGNLCLSITHSDGGETNTWNIPYSVEFKPGAGSHIPTEYYTALTEAAALAATHATNAMNYSQNAKDSEEAAKESASEAKEAAAADIEKLDVSDKITLTKESGGSGLTSYQFTEKQYIYVPKLKMVFYQLCFMFTGSLAENEVVTFTHSGGYAPHEHLYLENPASVSHKFLTAAYQPDTSFCLRSTQDMNTGGLSSPMISFSGWYFCDGE